MSKGGEKIINSAGRTFAAFAERPLLWLVAGLALGGAIGFVVLAADALDAGFAAVLALTVTALVVYLASFSRACDSDGLVLVTLAGLMLVAAWAECAVVLYGPVLLAALAGVF